MAVESQVLCNRRSLLFNIRHFYESFSISVEQHELLHMMDGSIWNYLMQEVQGKICIPSRLRYPFFFLMAAVPSSSVGGAPEPNVSETHKQNLVISPLFNN